MRENGDRSTLALRLPGRASQSALLRAQLRLWLLANRAGEPGDAFDILASATRAFLLALWRPGPVRTLWVDVEARYADGVVEVVVHDHGGRGGNSIRFERLVTPVSARASTAAERVSRLQD
jgi:hypothetical protein